MEELSAESAENAPATAVVTNAAGGPRVAVAHLYASGPWAAEGPHGLLHVGLLPLMAGAEPLHWRLNPERAISKAVSEAAQIPIKHVAEAPNWSDQKAEIQAAFGAFDALLILDRAGQPGPERHWFEHHILTGLTRPPVCIGLDELTAFWLPAETLDDADDLLDRLVRTDAAWQRRIGFSEAAPRLPFVLHCLRRVVRRVLASLLAIHRPNGPTADESAENGARWQPAYALLDSIIAPVEGMRPAGLRAFRLLRALARTPDCADEPLPPDGQEQLAFRRLVAPQTFTFRIEKEQIRKLLAQWLSAWRARATDSGTSGDVEIGTPLPPTGAELSAVFKYLGGQRPDWKPRAAQEQYAKFVAAAIGGRGPYALEAGTGTGKTFGYLVPALEYLRKTNGGRVIVATSTKNLQDQIVSGELPALLGPPGARNPLYQSHIRAAVLKGKNCYVCADALSRTFEDAFRPGAPWAESLAWLYLAIRLRDTEGEIEGIAPQVTARLGGALWQLLRATTADKACRHEATDDLPECTYPVHRRRAEAANLIITNHHKLALLPPKVRDNGGICIIDEADRFPDNFRGALSRRVDGRELHDELVAVLLGAEYLTSTKNNGLLNRLDERLAPEETSVSRKAYEQTDGLMALRSVERADADDVNGQLDFELESLLLADLASADHWAQVAEACAETPLAAEAETERDDHLLRAAVRALELRRWRAVRAVRAATHEANAPLRALARTLRSMGTALRGHFTNGDGDVAIPYPPDEERRWQDRFSTWEPGRGTQWHQLDRALCHRLDFLADTLGTVAKALAPIREQLMLALPPPPSEAEERQPPADPDKQLRERAARTADLAQRAAELTRQMRTEFPCRAQLHTIQHDQHAPDELGWRLTRQPYDLAPYLFTPDDPETGDAPTHLSADPVVPLLDTFRSVVFTSATLFVENSLTYFRRLLDLPGGFADEARIRSPFHYDKAVLGAVPHFLAPYDSGWPKLDRHLWQLAALETVLPLILALDGRTLILFTSNEEMRMAADWLTPRLADHDIETLVQNGASQWEIRRFRRVEQSVLLGVDRMWTGVDFAGLTLAHVVVWRAPFPAVGDPLIAHRKQYETSDVYWDGFYYPSTRLKLRQGFGRLIRREADRGAFTLLDSRLSAARKHHHLLAELEVPLAEYGSRAALCEHYIPEVLGLLRLKTDFERRGWSAAQLLTV